MIKLELIYNVREKLKIHSDDSETSDEFISHLLDLKRVKVIQQQIGKTPYRIPIETRQEIKLTTEVVNNIDGLSCFGKILRTKDAVPNMVRSKGLNFGVTLRRGDKTALLIDLVALDRLPFVGYGTFISQLVFAAFDYDNKVYLVSNQKKHMLMETLYIGGIFEDPEAARKLGANYDSSIDEFDVEYPLSLELSDLAVELVARDLVSSLAIKEDKTNDGEKTPQN